MTYNLTNLSTLMAFSLAELSTEWLLIYLNSHIDGF